jgi:hypothetical protein
MRAGDEAFDALRAAIDELADVEAAELVAEARIEARAKVRSILSEAMAHALLERSQTELGQSVAPPAPARPRRQEGRRAARATRTMSREPPPFAASVRERQATNGVAAETEQSTSAAPAQGSAGELGWYVYGVVGRVSFDPPDSLTGVRGGHPVTVLREGALAAVASQVPLAEFGEETLRESLDDVGWLEDTARGHERVLEEVRALTTVIPMRLCTIYSSQSSVAQMLARERAPLTEALERLTAKTEWGVKIFVDPSAAERAAKEGSDEAGRLDAALADAAPGSAYMRRKQLDGFVRVRADHLIEECVEDAHSRLSTLSVEALSNPLQRPEAAGHVGQMVLNGVYLLEDARADAFHAAIAGLADKYGSCGFDFEATGPWPPYNFVKSSIEAAW